MEKRLLYLFLTVFSIVPVTMFAQSNDPVIMKVNGKDIKKSEFEYIYNKNNNEESIDKKSLEEYVELFVNFKLKVTEAETQGLDTTASFKTELAEYRAQLAKPYLDNLPVNENLITKEYDRMKDLVEVSHILIAFPGALTGNFKFLPSDTLEAYKKAIQVQNRIRKGENFEKVAAEVSDDEQNAKGAKPGYLGWFTGMTLNIALEEAAFTTSVGKTSLVRSNFGYHIVKVNAKKENPGQINAAHILIFCQDGADTIQVADAQEKINGIYDALQAGGDFAELAKEKSEDTESGTRGGDLGWFGIGMMVPEFQDAAFGINEIGKFSKPFKTQYGYHIVKLLGRKSLEPLAEKKQEIESRLKNSGFFIPLYEQAINDLKVECNFKKEDAAYEALFSFANSAFPTDSLFAATWGDNTDVLFKIGNQSFLVSDFIKPLKSNVRSPYSLSTDLLADRLKYFEYVSLLEVKDELLEGKYPEFRNLVQEYHDGILMFEVSNREVWEKASEDAEGLADFFQKNKQNYSWDKPAYKGYIVWVKDAKMKKKLEKEVSKKHPDEAAKLLVDNHANENDAIKIEKGLFKKGDNTFVDEAAFKGTAAERPEGFPDFFLIGKTLTAPESYEDVKGLIITDYQDYLEKEWLKKLHEKYPVSINKDVLITIK
jgi:peptidyl-prolyl cis-trans isomerase SurA